jgi:glycosyltransferase involved in cell wall biosynthesis
LVEDGIDPIKVIWNGVPVQPPHSPLSAPPTVVFAGRLVREKGVDVLLHAFEKVVSRIPEALLMIIGDGPEKVKLDRLIGELGLNSNISMLGHLSRSETERYCAKAWVQAVPSRWAEPFGLVAAEAMMRGTPVVASACGGLTEIIQHGKTGFLVPPDDVNAWAEILIHLLDDLTWAEQIGQAARTFAQAHLTDTRYIDQFVKVYETLCTGGHRGTFSKPYGVQS